MNLEGQAKRSVGDFPRVRQRPAKLPFAAAGFAAVVETVPVFPPGRGFAIAAVPGPDDLRVGPHEGVITPALLLHAFAAIEQLIILPAVGDDKGGTLRSGRHGATGSEGGATGAVETPLRGRLART